MQNLILSMNVVLPLFFLMALGYFLTKIGSFTDDVIDRMNSVSFQVFLPCLLFYNIYTTDFRSAISPKFILYGVGSLCLMFLIALLAVPFLEKDGRCRSVLMVGIFRSNYIIFGMPIVIALFGQEHTGPISILSGIVVPMVNLFSVVAYELYRGGKIDFKKMLKGIITNPLILASLLAFALLLFRVRLPFAVSKTVGDVAKLATPLALIFLGASFQFKGLAKNLRQLIIGLGGKLVVYPLIFITAAVLAGFRGPELIALVVLYAAPTAISSFTMARQMEADSELAGQLVVLGSALAVFVMFVIIFILKSNGWI